MNKIASRKENRKEQKEQIRADNKETEKKKTYRTERIERRTDKDISDQKIKQKRRIKKHIF